MTDHTTMPQVSRLEVIETGARRRWTLEEKLRIVAESQAGTRQVSATARRHGLSPALLFTWRRLAREGRLQTDDEGSFARAVIAAEGRWNEPALAAGRIEIVLANGLRVIVDRQVDAVALTRVLGVVARQ